MTKTYVKTSESVARSHPDKVADQIGDSIFDYLRTLKKDAQSAVEVAAAADTLLIFGEIDKDIVRAKNGITSVEYANPELAEKIKEIAVERLRLIGYDKDTYNPTVLVKLVTQSAEINNAVEENEEHEAAAGDQGIVTGFAVAETKQFHALHYILANRIIKDLEADRDNGRIEWLLPDAKSQVTVKYEYSEKGLDIPVSIENILVSQCYSDSVSLEEVRTQLENRVKEIAVEFLNDNKLFLDADKLIKSLEKAEFLINPAGAWHKGGPASDSGLSSRKLVVDNYGSAAPIGGGGTCVDGETEYLHAPGKWKKISEYSPGDKVAQWDNGVIEFVNPLKYHKYETDENLWHFKHGNIDMVLSSDHEVLYKTSKNNLNKKKVIDLYKMHENNVTGFRGGDAPVYFEYSSKKKGVNLSSEEIRLMIAFAADGTILPEFQEHYKWNGRIAIKRPEKIERLTAILNNIPHYQNEVNYKITQSKTRTIFWLKIPNISKRLNEMFADANEEQYKIIANEIFYWDGDFEQKIFRTSIKEDADFIQFILGSVYQTCVGISKNDRRGESQITSGKEYTRKSVAYEVRVLRHKYTSLRKSSHGKESLSIVPFEANDGRKYCFTVPSGNLILRRNDKIFATGNCGKNFNKVDRSGAYYARHIAKSVVASGLADKCLVELGFAIGVPKAVSVNIETFGTENTSLKIINEKVRRMFDFRTQSMIDLCSHISEVVKTSEYGNYTDDTFPWEKTVEL